MSRRFYRSQGGFAADNADFLFGFESYDGAPGETDEAPELPPAQDPRYRTLTEVAARPARTFAQWARDHATDFISR